MEFEDYEKEHYNRFINALDNLNCLYEKRMKIDAEIIEGMKDLQKKRTVIENENYYKI